MKLPSPPVLISCLCLAAPGLTPSLEAAGAALSAAEFRKLHRQVRPPADEPWRMIPWRTSLLEAQKVAATEKKPIFIWAMDGHPLGCT